MSNLARSGRGSSGGYLFTGRRTSVIFQFANPLRSRTMAKAACCGSGTGPVVRSMPANGCSGFEREPGSDEELGRMLDSIT